MHITLTATLWEGEVRSKGMSTLDRKWCINLRALHVYATTKKRREEERCALLKTEMVRSVDTLNSSYQMNVVFSNLSLHASMVALTVDDKQISGPLLQVQNSNPQHLDFGQLCWG